MAFELCVVLLSLVATDLCVMEHQIFLNPAHGISGTALSRLVRPIVDQHRTHPPA